MKGRTHCVDTTITNILEGRVSYVPEKDRSVTKSSCDGNRSTPLGFSKEVGILSFFSAKLRIMNELYLTQ